MHQPLPTSDAIRAALQEAGAPEPASIDPVPALGRRVARMRLGGRDWLARFVVDTPGSSPERAQVAAASWGGQLPIPRPVLALRRGLVVPGALHPLPPGAPAATLARAEALEAVGRALAAIQAVELPARGTLDTATGFAPRATRWSAEVVEQARRDHGCAVSLGLDLGPLSEALVDWVDQRGGALDAGEGAVPVHGRLDPRRVFVDGEGAVVAVVGWEQACAGDREQDWGSLVLTDGFAAVARGFGSLDALRTDEATARVEAHAACFLLRSLADLGDDTPARRALSRQAVAVAARSLLDGAVGQRLADPEVALPAPDVLDGLTRGAVHALGERPDPLRGGRALTALALLGLARAHPDHTEGLVRHAEAQLAGIPAAGWPRASADRVDRQGWWAELALVAIGEATDDPPLGQAAAALWLVHDALERLDWSVPTHVLRGLQAHLLAVRASRPSVEGSAGGTREAGALRGLAHGLLAAAAFQELGGALGSDPEPLVEAARAQLDRAATTLDYGALAARGIAGDVASALPGLVERDAMEGPSALLPQLLLALDRLGADTWRVVPAAALTSLV